MNDHDEPDTGDVGPVMALVLILGFMAGVAAFIYAVAYTLNQFGVIG